MTSVLSLSVALGGAPYAVSQLPRTSVISVEIEDGQVRTGDLATSR